MKTTIFLLLLTITCNSQCLTDVPRQGYYTNMEVYNNSTGGYEKYHYASTTSLSVTINTEDNQITFKDKINNYNKRFEIKACIMLDTALIYRCIDLDNKEKCDMIFNADSGHYKMMVIYIPEPIIFRVKRKK